MLNGLNKGWKINSQEIVLTFGGIIVKEKFFSYENERIIKKLKKIIRNKIKSED